MYKFFEFRQKEHLAFTQISEKPIPSRYTKMNTISVILQAIVWISLALVIDSFIEHYVHRILMHVRGIPLFGYFYQKHVPEHHALFDGKDTFHHEEHVHTIVLAPWAGPLLIISAVAPAAIASLITGYWLVTYCFLGTAIAYYAMFEYIHVCMHSEKDRMITKTNWFKFLVKHHELHHQRWGKNFNLVLPLADKILGKMITK